MQYSVTLMVPDRDDPVVCHDVKAAVIVKHGQDGLEAAKQAVKRYTPSVNHVEQVWLQEELDVTVVATAEDPDQERIELDPGEVEDADFEEVHDDVDTYVEEDEGGQAPGETGPEEGPGDE